MRKIDKKKLREKRQRQKIRCRRKKEAWRALLRRRFVCPISNILLALPSRGYPLLLHPDNVGEIETILAASRDVQDKLSDDKTILFRRFSDG